MDWCGIEKLEDATSSYAGSGFASRAGDIRYATSKQTERYDEGIRVVPRNITVVAGMFFSFNQPVPYLPPQWSAHIHPEGQMYFYKDAAIRIVTEANINDPKVLEKVEYWVQVVEKLLPQKGLTPTENVELLIKIDGNDCSHYFIDHQSQTIFWMEPLETDEMGIEPVASPAHLRLALQEFYWIHVEFFPVHVKDLAPNVLEELISVFSHALADHMTSRNSTFPYDVRDCTTFLKLLRSFRGQPQDGYMRCVIARLWQLVFKHRFETLYGESHARLSRDQAIFVETTRESRMAHILTSVLSFKTSDYYVSKLNNIYVDHLVYVHQWQPFMQKCLRDWKSSSYLSLMASLSYLLLNNIPTLRIFTVFSACCFGLSFISSILLVHRHDTLDNATAADALSYLSDVCSDGFKFQWVAFVYSLPKTFLFWGAIGFVANCLVAVSAATAGDAPWMPYFLGISGLCLLAIVAFQGVTSDAKLLRLPSIRWRKARDLETLPI